MREMVCRPPAPIGGGRADWMLKDGLTFLNHGSFGAVPKLVYDAQDHWRRRIEAEPIELLGRRCTALLDQAKEKIGSWLGMKPADFGLVTNATEGINAVLRSLRFREGDELLTTNHVYNAVRQAMKYVARQSGAAFREVELPLPIGSQEQILNAIQDAISPRTRLLVIDHVTSPTAIVFPVERIAEMCAQRGVDLAVDGAHAPGMLELDVPKIGAAYYAGNLHKWACAPKGSAFIWVRPDRQSQVHPTVISHNLDQGFTSEFAWQGTRDISAHLTAPKAIEFMASFGWERVRRHNHELAVWAHRMLCERWRVEPISPLDGRMLGSMATVRLPGRLSQLTEETERKSQQRLYDEYAIETPLIRWYDGSFLRVSCQIYNRPEEYQRLAGVIEEMSAG